jgi:hypothetical protein
MEDVKELESSLGLKLTEKFVLNKQIGQLKQLQGVLGKKQVQVMIDSTNMNQKQKEYIYMKMGWL